MSRTAFSAESFWVTGPSSSRSLEPSLSSSLDLVQTQLTGSTPFARECHPMALPGTSWHATTEPSVPNSPRQEGFGPTALQPALPRSAHLLAGQDVSSARILLTNFDRPPSLRSWGSRVRIAPGSPFGFAHLAEPTPEHRLSALPNQTEPIRLAASSPGSSVGDPGSGCVS